MHITIMAGATIGKLQILKCHKYDDSGKEIGFKYVNVQALKEKGVIKRANDFKRAEAFLNTDEGMAFYDETPHTSHR